MADDSPLVSIIVPVWNGQQFIDRALASARAQTYQAIEIIVVDDGSTDDSVAIVERIAKQDKRVRLFRRSHCGVSASRNFGRREASGSLVAYLDADDLWHPDKLLREVEAMMSCPNVGVVYCWSIEIDEDDFVIPPVRSGRLARGDVFLDVVANAGISTVQSLIRRSCLEAVGGFDESLPHAEDWKLYVALAKICEFAVIPSHLIGYRRSKNSASRQVAAMAKGMENVSVWIGRQWPDTPKIALRRMAYSKNSYLAHLALTNHQVLQAARYKLAALGAWPSAVPSRDTAEFAVRLLARTVGITRRNWTPKANLTAFKDFQPRLDPRIKMQKPDAVGANDLPPQT